MKIRDEECEIAFMFESAEEHKSFVKALKGTRNSICGNTEWFCWACPLARVHTKDGLDLCSAIDEMFAQCS